MSLEKLSERVIESDIQYLIRTKARELCRANGFTRADREDLAQELTLRLLQRIKAYDPAKASFYCFALVVLDRVGIHLIESRSAACRDTSSTVSLQTPVRDSDGRTTQLAGLVGDDERGNRVGRYRDSEGKARDLSLDVREILEALPGKSRKLARRLVKTSRAEIARRTGESEDRLRESFRQIREAFEQTGLGNYLSEARE